MDTVFFTVLLIASALVLASILVSPLSQRVGMPVLLLFLGIGMLAGEDGPGNIEFDDVSIVYMVANLALAIILLDGGMRTRVESFRVGLKPALVLATAGVVVTALVGGLAASWLLDLPLIQGLLIGAIVSSTDAAAVFSLLQGKGLSLNERVRATLEIESGSNDPMAIFLTLMFIDWIGDPQSSLASGLWMLLQQFGLGALFGLAAGQGVAAMLRKVKLVSAMYPGLILSSGLLLFSLCNLLGGSGFLAIYLMGVTLASRRNPQMANILQFHDGLTWLAQLVLFLLLGLLVTPSQLLATLPQALAIAAVLIVVARPIATTLGLWPFGFSRREHLFMGWAGLRGAVPVVLAIFPLIAGIDAAAVTFQVAFVVVLVSLLLQGSTLAPLARWLGLEIPPRPEPSLRVELQVPAASGHELLLFPLRGARWRQGMDVSDIHLPDPSRVVMFFRDGRMFESRRGLRVREHDVLAVLAHQDQTADVAQVLGWEEPPERLTDRRFFGEFTLNGDAVLRDIQIAYGVEIPHYDPTLTLSDCFSRVQRGHPVVGDRLDLGTLLLVVRDVQGDKVLKVGLKLSR